MRVVKPGHLTTEARGRQELLGIAESTRIECGAHTIERGQIAARKHLWHRADLVDADAMFARDGPAELDAEFDNAHRHGFRALLLPGDRVVVQHEWVEVAVAGMEDVRDAYARLVGERTDAAEHLWQSCARNHAILHEIRWRDRSDLVPRQRTRNGLLEDEAMISEGAIRKVIRDHTREAGVRTLERQLGTLLRKAATRLAAGEAEAPMLIDVDSVLADLGRAKFHDEVAERTGVAGVATGLAVTSVGGDVLFVEASSHPGTGGPTLTGQLGDVMRESATIAISHVRANAADYGIDQRVFEDRQFHLHVPAGAVPKDGPSAGVTMSTALVSLLTGRHVRPDVAMTGEVTLRGRVLPVGGIKQKVLAAHRAGITDVIIPKRNEGDLDDVPAEVLAELTIHPVVTLEEALAVSLEPVAHWDMLTV